MPNEDLKSAYLETVYSVFVGEQQHDIKINRPAGDAISQLLNKHALKTGYIMTAWNPRSQALSESENNIRNSRLKTELLELNCTVYDAVGTGSDPGWTPEASFFIVGLDATQAEQLALKYEQNAYVKIEADQPATLVFSAFWKE